MVLKDVKNVQHGLRMNNLADGSATVLKKVIPRKTLTSLNIEEVEVDNRLLKGIKVTGCLQNLDGRVCEVWTMNVRNASNLEV